MNYLKFKQKSDGNDAELLIMSPKKFSIFFFFFFSNVIYFGLFPQSMQRKLDQEPKETGNAVICMCIQMETKQIFSFHHFGIQRIHENLQLSPPFVPKSEVYLIKGFRFGGILSEDVCLIVSNWTS